MMSFLAPEKRRWLIVAVIFGATMLNYVDRQIVSILKPSLKTYFHLNDGGYAVIINLFTISYALMYPVTGWLVDRFGARLTMFYGIIAWSLACFGGGLSGSVGTFAFSRGVLGLAEPINFPAQLSVVSTWFSGKLRATANSFCVAGSSIGAIMAPPLIAWLAIGYSWQTVFVITGIAGLGIALLWISIYRDPPKQVIAEVAVIDQNINEKAFGWRQLWSTKSLWGIILIRFISDPVWYFCLFWLPGYLQEKSGLSLGQLGAVGWIPFLVADVAAIGMSIWSDGMVRRGRQPLTARKIMLTTVTVFAPVCALIPFLPHVALTLIVFSITGAVCLSWLFSVSVVIAETFPVKNVASVLGIAGGFGAIGAVLFNYTVGLMINTVGAGKLFFIMALLHPLAAIILWKMVGPENPERKYKKTLNHYGKKHGVNSMQILPTK